MRLNNEWGNPQEETKLEDAIAEVEEASGQELKRVKVEDQKEAIKIEDGDVTQDRFMEEEKTVVMEITEAVRLSELSRMIKNVMRDVWTLFRMARNHLRAKKVLCSSLLSRKLHQKLLSRRLSKRMMSRDTM